MLFVVDRHDQKLLCSLPTGQSLWSWNRASAVGASKGSYASEDLYKLRTYHFRIPDSSHYQLSLDFEIEAIV
jgi:hypothetical protein